MIEHKAYLFAFLHFLCCFLVTKGLLVCFLTLLELFFSDEDDHTLGALICFLTLFVCRVLVRKCLCGIFFAFVVLLCVLFQLQNVCIYSGFLYLLRCIACRPLNSKDCYLEMRIHAKR